MERFDFYNKLIEENKEQERKLHQRMMEGNENLKRTLKKIKKDMEKVSLYSNVNYDAFKSDPQISNSTMQNQYDMKFTSSNSNNFSESLNMHHNNKQMNLTEPQSLIDAKHKNNNFTFKDNIKGGSDMLKENDEMLQQQPQLLEGSERRGVDYRKYGNVGNNEELTNDIQLQQSNNEHNKPIINDKIQQQQQPVMNMRGSVDSNNDYSAEEIEEKVLTGSNQDMMMQTASIKGDIGNVKGDEMEFQTQQLQQQQQLQLQQPQQQNLNEDKLLFQHKQFDKEQTSPQFSQQLSQHSPSKTTQSYNFAGINAPLDSNAHFNIASSNISNKDILSNTNNTMNNIFYQQNPNQFNQSQSQNYSQRQYQQYPSQFQQYPEISSTSIYNNQSQSQTGNNFYNQTNLPPNSSPSVNLTNNAQFGSDAYSQLTYNKNLNNITSSQIDNTSQAQFYPNPSSNNPNATGFQKAFPQNNNNSNYEMSQTFNSKSSTLKVKKNIPQQDDHYFSYKNPEVHPDDIYVKSYLRGYKIKSSQNNLKRKLTPKEKEYVKLNQETAIAKSRQLYLERLNKKQQEEAKKNYLNIKKMTKKQNGKGKSNNNSDLDNKRKFASNDYEEYKIYEQKVMDKLAKEELYADVGNTRDLLGEFVDRVIERSLYLYKNRHCHSCARLLSKGKSTEGCPKCHHLLQVRNIKG